MSAQEVIDELQKLVKEHGDCVIMSDGCEVLDVYYDDEDDTINV